MSDKMMFIVIVSDDTYESYTEFPCAVYPNLGMALAHRTKAEEIVEIEEKRVRKERSEFHGKGATTEWYEITRQHEARLTEALKPFLSPTNEKVFENPMFSVVEVLYRDLAPEGTK